MTKKRKTLLEHIIEHDKNHIFNIAFLFFAFGLSLFLNLGFFIAVVFFHLLLDVTKHYHTIEESIISHRRIRKAVRLSLEEDIVDVAFIFIGLVIEIYLHFSFGLAASRGVREIEIFRVSEALPRLIIIERAARYLKYALHISGYKAFERIAEKIKRLSIVTIIICALLIIFSPLILQESYSDIWQNYVLEEIIPSLAPRF